MKLNLMKKMILSFLVIAAINIAGFMYMIAQMNQIQKSAHQLEGETFRKYELLHDIQINIEKQISTFRLFMMTGNLDVIQDFKEVAKNNNNIKDDLFKLPNSDKEKATINEIKKLGDKYASTALDTALPMFLAGKREEAAQHMSTIGTPITKDLERLLNIELDSNQKVIEKAIHSTVVSIENITNIMIGLGITIVLLAVIIGFLTARNISSALGQLLSLAQSIATGDLTQTIDIKRNDEIGLLAEANNKMIQNIKTLISKINANSELLAASSQQLNASAEQSAQVTNQVAQSISGIAHSVDDQSHAVVKTNQVIDEISDGIGQIATNISATANQAIEAASKAKDGNELIDQAIKQMKSIEKSASAVATTITKLDSRSQEIGQIIDTISGIAAQTNLLALNAAIEAARAGEQGRGFAVVAEEVRKLAEQSQNSAKQISTMINDIQNETSAAVSVMTAGSHEVALGSEIVSKAGDAFATIVDLVSKVSNQAEDISLTTNSLREGSNHVVKVMNNLSDTSKQITSETQTVSAATEEQAATMQEMSTSSQTLATMAQNMQQEIASFKI